MSQQSWSLKLGNKGFVFTLDMIIAITFTLMILTFANYYVRVNESSLPKLQMEKTGSDIVALLDHYGSLDNIVNGANGTEIEEPGDLEDYLEDFEEDNFFLEDVLPINYDMHINITSKNTIQLSIGSDIPSNTSIISGKRVFVVSYLNETTQEREITDYAFLQYWIWLK